MKLKHILIENPDTVDARTQRVKINAYTEPNYPFGYYKNKMYIGEENEYHGDMYINDKINITREDMTYPGRVWPDDKIISLWTFPTSQHLKTIVNDLNNAFKSKKLRYKINPHTWFIDSLNDNLSENLVTIYDYIMNDLSPKTKLGINDWEELFDLKSKKW